MFSIYNGVKHDINGFSSRPRVQALLVLARKPSSISKSTPTLTHRRVVVVVEDVVEDAGAAMILQEVIAPNAVEADAEEDVANISNNNKGP